MKWNVIDVGHIEVFLIGSSCVAFSNSCINENIL